MVRSFSPVELSKNGKVAYQRSNYQTAAQLFNEARQYYIDIGDDLNAAEMANNCAVAFLHLGEAETALKLIQGTDQIFERAHDQCRQGMALGNLATAFESLDRFEEAIEVYKQSAKLLHEAGEDQLQADVMRSLSSLQLRMGQQLQALISLQVGLENIRHPNPTQRLTKKLLHVPFDFLNKNIS